MNLVPLNTRGRFLTSGPFCFLLAGILLCGAPAGAEDDPTRPQELTVILDRLAELQSATPPDIEALHAQYLVLFQNFPHHQEGKEGIFELYHLLRRHGRTSEAYAVLMQIQGTYQDKETMLLPGKGSRPVGLVVTARLEEAHLYATAMANPYQAIETLQQTRQRYRDQLVGVVAADRAYYGRVEVWALLHLADYRLLAEQTNRASADLLELVRERPGEKIDDGPVTQTAPEAAVLRLAEVVRRMPASLPKKQRVLTTFEETTVEEKARVRLALLRADVYFDHYRQWPSPGTFTEGAEALRSVIARQRQVMLSDASGSEPAGIRAMRRLRDAEAAVLGNVMQAGQTLEALHNQFRKNGEDRPFAAYALLFLAEVEVDFRGNPQAAFQLFKQVAEQYGDVAVYPQTPDNEKATLRERAELWAQRAQQRIVPDDH